MEKAAAGAEGATEAGPSRPVWLSVWVLFYAFLPGPRQLKMLLRHRGALQLHARSLKVVANLHEKEQTAVILTFNEEAQPAETASSASLVSVRRRALHHLGQDGTGRLWDRGRLCLCPLHTDLKRG